jgi:hypothetical protein
MITRSARPASTSAVVFGTVLLTEGRYRNDGVAGERIHVSCFYDRQLTWKKHKVQLASMSGVNESRRVVESSINIIFFGTMRWIPEYISISEVAHVTRTLLTILVKSNVLVSWKGLSDRNHGAFCYQSSYKLSVHN